MPIISISLENIFFHFLKAQLSVAQKNLIFAIVMLSFKLCIWRHTNYIKGCLTICKQFLQSQYPQLISSKITRVGLWWGEGNLKFFPTEIRSTQLLALRQKKIFRSQITNYFCRGKTLLRQRGRGIYEVLRKTGPYTLPPPPFILSHLLPSARKWQKLNKSKWNKCPIIIPHQLLLWSHINVLTFSAGT